MFGYGLWDVYNTTAMQERATLAMSLSANNNFVSLLDGVSKLFSNIFILLGVVCIVVQFEILLIIVAVFAVGVQGILFYRNTKLNMKIDEDSSIISRYINLLHSVLKPNYKYYELYIIKCYI